MVPSGKTVKVGDEVSPGICFEGQSGSGKACVIRFIDDRLTGDGELPPFYFKTTALQVNSERVSIVSIDGKIVRSNIDDDRSVCLHAASVAFGTSIERRLGQCKPGDCFMFGDSMFMFVNQPAKSQDGNIYAVSLDGTCARTFNGDRSMAVFENVKFEINP